MVAIEWTSLLSVKCFAHVIFRNSIGIIDIIAYWRLQRWRIVLYYCILLIGCVWVILIEVFISLFFFYIIHFVSHHQYLLSCTNIHLVEWNGQLFIWKYSFVACCSCCCCCCCRSWICNWPSLYICCYSHKFYFSSLQR